MPLIGFVFLFCSDDNLEFLPHCESDGSFHVLHGWFIVLLTIFPLLLTIVSIDLFSGVTGYYTETLGKFVLPLTSHPQTHDAWSVFLYHYSQSLFMVKDDACTIPDTPTQSTFAQVRLMSWSSRGQAIAVGGSGLLDCAYQKPGQGSAHLLTWLLGVSRGRMEEALLGSSRSLCLTLSLPLSSCVTLVRPLTLSISFSFCV